MKEIRRSRRLRLPHRRHQLPKSITSDGDDDESDFEHEIFQKKLTGQTNKNANRIATSLFDTIPTLPIEQKLLQSSSDQSSLFLYSINSKQKATTISDDLTPLTIRTTNTTPLTALTYSNTKQTDLGIVKIDLTDLSGTDTLDSSLSNTDHDQSLSLNRKFSLSNINHKIKDDTDTSMKSIVFSKDNSFDQELSYQKHLSCYTIPDVGNRDRMTVVSPTSSSIKEISLPITINANINTDQPSSVRWNFQNMTNRFKFIIGCSSLGLIAGIILLVIIL